MGWAVLLKPETGAVYYHNLVTGEVTWDKPHVVDDDDREDDVDTATIATTTTSSNCEFSSNIEGCESCEQTNVNPKKRKQAVQKRSEWVKYKDSQGNFVFVDKVYGIVSKLPPKDHDARAIPAISHTGVTVVQVALLETPRSANTVGDADALLHSLQCVAQSLHVSIEVCRDAFRHMFPYGPICGNACCVGASAWEAGVLVYMRCLHAELLKYPSDFFPLFKIKRVFLVTSLTLAGSPRAAIPETSSHTLYVDAAPKHFTTQCHSDLNYLRRVFHHELFHMVDFALMGARAARDPAWCRLNDAAFSYGEGGQTMQNDSLSSAFSSGQPGFLNRYCTSSCEEDKAELFSWLMTTPTPHEVGDSILSNKISLIKARLQGNCPSAGEQFWCHTVATRTGDDVSVSSPSAPVAHGAGWFDPQTRKFTYYPTTLPEPTLDISSITGIPEDPAHGTTLDNAHSATTHAHTHTPEPLADGHSTPAHTHATALEDAQAGGTAHSSSGTFPHSTLIDAASTSGARERATACERERAAVVDADSDDDDDDGDVAVGGCGSCCLGMFRRRRRRRLSPAVPGIELGKRTRVTPG